MQSRTEPNVPELDEAFAALFVELQTATEELGAVGGDLEVSSTPGSGSVVRGLVGLDRPGAAT